MLTASIEGIKYHRVLAAKVDIELTKNLKSDFDYSFIVCYGDFQDADYEVQVKKSAVIFIPKEGNIEDILNTFSATCRNEIRRTFKTPEISVEINPATIKEAYDFHAACERERNWIPIPFDEFRKSLIVCIKYDNNYIAGMSCYENDEFIRVGRIFSRRRSEEFKNIPSVIFSAAQRRVVYELCNIALTQNKTQLDLGGIDFDNPSKKGIADFKLSFGSEITPVNLGRFEKETFTAKKELIKSKGIDIT